MNLQVGDEVTMADKPRRRWRVTEVHEQHGIIAYQLAEIVETADEAADRVLDGIRQAAREEHAR
jgi:hypothetical protein